MTTYGIAEAKARLSSLIDRALGGEGVVITRHGQPMVELRAVVAPARALTVADVDWLTARRVPGTGADAGALVSRMRDEDER